MKSSVATKEFFELNLTCSTCGVGLLVKAEHIDYTEGTDSAAPDEFFYYVHCGRCLIITRVPSGIIPPHVQQEAKTRTWRATNAEPTTRFVGEVWLSRSEIFWGFLRGRLKVKINRSPQNYHGSLANHDLDTGRPL